MGENGGEVQESLQGGHIPNCVKDSSLSNEEVKDSSLSNEGVKASNQLPGGVMVCLEDRKAAFEMYVSLPLMLHQLTSCIILLISIMFKTISVYA